MDFKAVAEQLRKPDGDFGKQIAANMNVSNERMNRLAIEKLQLQTGDNILEIGMGNGAFVKDILTENVSYTGADFSETMVQDSISRNQEFIKTGKANFLQANAQKLPFADNSYNKAFTINTIYFWENPGSVFTEIRRVLQPGGKFVIGIRPKHSMINYPFTAYGFNLYEKTDLLKLLENNYFRITDITEETEPDQQIAEVTVKPESLIIATEVERCA